jgi:hypothetical protein
MQMTRGEPEYVCVEQTACCAFLWSLLDILFVSMLPLQVPDGRCITCNVLGPGHDETKQRLCFLILSLIMVTGLIESPSRFTSSACSNLEVLPVSDSSTESYAFVTISIKLRDIEKRVVPEAQHVSAISEHFFVLCYRSYYYNDAEAAHPAWLTYRAAIGEAHTSTEYALGISDRLATLAEYRMIREESLLNLQAIRRAAFGAQDENSESQSRD